MAGLSLFPSENLWTTKLQPLDWPVHLPTNSVNMVQVCSSIEHATSYNIMQQPFRSTWQSPDPWNYSVLFEAIWMVGNKVAKSQTIYQNYYLLGESFQSTGAEKKLPTNSRDLWSTSVVVPIECHPCKEQPQPDRQHSRTTCQKSSATRQRNASQGQNAAKSIGSVSWHWFRTCGIYVITFNIL